MRTLPLIVALAVLSGCGSSEPPPPPKKTVFDPLTDQLHKVEQKAATMPDQRKADLDKQIDSNSN